jgi:hypothetical protein
MKPELTDFFASGKVDRIFHQKYCYNKALLRALKHFPNSLFYNSCEDNIKRGVTIVD